MSIHLPSFKRTIHLRTILWMGVFILSLGVALDWWMEFDLEWGRRFVLPKEDPLYGFAFLFTQLFRWEMATILTLSSAYVLLTKHERRYAINSLLAMGLAVGLAALMKWGFARPRPVYSTITEIGFAFPSGHSAAASALVSIICLAYGKMMGRGRGFRVVVCLSALLAGIIGLTRLILGVHYVTDILGGFLVGYLSADMVHSFTKR